MRATRRRSSARPTTYPLRCAITSPTGARCGVAAPGGDQVRSSPAALDTAVHFWAPPHLCLWLPSSSRRALSTPQRLQPTPFPMTHTLHFPHPKAHTTARAPHTCPHRSPTCGRWAACWLSCAPWRAPSTAAASARLCWRSSRAPTYQYRTRTGEGARHSPHAPGAAARGRPQAPARSSCLMQCFAAPRFTRAAAPFVGVASRVEASPACIRLWPQN